MAEPRLQERGSRHVDVFKTDPLSGDGPKFLKRVGLDDPVMVTPDGKPTQVAIGWASYVCVSEPHTMEDCPYGREDPDA